MTRTRKPSAASPTTSRGLGTRRRGPIRYLDEVEIAYVIHALAERLFPSMPAFELTPDGLALLQSAIHTPRQRFYRTVHEKAAALFRSLVKDHALRDGNKRLAVAALTVFLRINGVDFKASQDAIVDAALAVAERPGNYPLSAITSWIRASCRGRPRFLVASFAENWELNSRGLMVDVRREDVRAGRRARIPGRHVGMRPDVRKRLGGVRVVPEPRPWLIRLQGGPRDGAQLELPRDFAGTRVGTNLIATYTGPADERLEAHYVIVSRKGRELRAQFGAQST